MNSVLLRLDWNGAVITRRAADDYVNLSALVRAHNLATGQKRKLQGWYRSTDAQEFLDALAAPVHAAPDRHATGGKGAGGLWHSAPSP